MRIAFIGLGHMGLPMAINLVKAGHDVLGYDPVPSALEAAAANGVSTQKTLEATAAGVDVAVTMLPNGEIARTVWSQLAPALAAGTVAIDCSTIDIPAAKDIHALAAARGLRSVDAPVSGGVAGAQAATLTFMCGGQPAALDAAEPVLAVMGKKVVRCGEAGSGQAAKICNNMVLGVSMIAVCEAFSLADRLGLDRQAMFDVVSTSSGACWSINTYCPVPGIGPKSPADNGYIPGFAAFLMLKDLKLATDAAAQVDAATPLGSHAAKLYEQFVAAGNGEKDFSAIILSLAAGRGAQ